MTWYRRWGKRLLDLVVVVPALVALAPLITVAALLVRLGMGKPVLFNQRRPGLGGLPFVLLKFRTMSDTRDSEANLLPDWKRLSPVGRFLRRTSLDELPTLWNVVKGDMSLVGPRPLLMQYLERYNSEQARRHEVKPGVTGWAQVNGRNALTWEEKFKLDVWYVDHYSFGLDLSILGMTLVEVLKGEGISAEGHATMPVFTGSKGNTNG
jgi:sugar transferase EpsL